MRILTAVMIVAAGAFVGQQPTAAAPNLIAVQKQLVATADVVADSIRGLDGLAGISAKPERGQVWVYWKGTVPAALKQRTDIKVVAAAYSEKELLAARDRVVAMRDPMITAVGPKGDGSGLTVSTLGPRQGALARAAGSAVSPAQVAGVPVTFEAGERPMLASRQNDISPYQGGAKFLWSAGTNTYRCTTGFTVLQGRVKKMLTAGHCGSNGLAIKRGDGTVWGTVNGDSNSHDTMLITPNVGSSVQGRLYVDAHSSNTSKAVNYGPLDSYLDTLVCTSGAKTGEHCKIRIKAKNLTITVADLNGNPYNISPVVKAEHDDHTNAGGTGDSGGPVVAQDSWGGPFGNGDFVNVYPMGTLTAIDTNTSVVCGSYDGSAPTCAWRIYYVNIMDSLAYYGATIVKG